MNAPFGIPIVIYLFLAGVAAGTALFASMTLHRNDTATFIAGKRSLLLAISAISVGILFLIADLASPLDFILILTRANTQSAIAWGARIVTAFLLVSVFCWALYRTKASGSATGGECAALWVLRLLALSLAIYPGFVLIQGKGIPLWNHSLIVPLLALSGLHAGIALSFLCAPGRRLAMPLGLQFLERVFLSALLVLGAGFLILTASHSVLPYGFLLVGVLLPILVLAKNPRSSGVLAGICALVGCLLLRTWLITDGQHLFF